MSRQRNSSEQTLQAHSNGRTTAVLERPEGSTDRVNRSRQSQDGRLLDEILRLVEASRAGHFTERGRLDQFAGSDRKLLEGVNTMLDAILLPIAEGNRVLARISAGKIDELINESYEGDHEKMKVAVNHVATVLQGLQREIVRLTTASREGQLSERGQTEQFQGAYADIVNGVNEMLDGILMPIAEGNRILRLIRGGNLREKVEIVCKGDHERMKNAINGVHEWLTELIAYVTKIANGDMAASMSKASDQDQIHEWLAMLKNNITALVTDANVLAQAAIEGRLGIRAEAGKHGGDFRKIMQGVNRIMDSLVGHLDAIPTPALIVQRDLSISYMNRVAANLAGLSQQAAIGTKCYEHFKSVDCNTERCAVAQCIQRGQPVTAETEVHPQARTLDISYTGVPIKDVEGKVIGALEVITDLTAVKNAARISQKQANFQAGEVEKLVVNLGRVARGDLNVEIAAANIDEDTHAIGENFAKINQSLDGTVHAVRALVKDADLLARAAADGKLATRADAAQHQGAFRKVIEGVNGTLEAVVEPLKVTAQNATTLASSAEELTAVSHQMAGNAEETATQANVVSAASEQVSKNVATVASGGEQMQASIREIAKNANEAARVAKHAVQVAHTTNGTVAKLGDSSTEIGNVIKVITSIAQQTNLLALNATIEAARAGEAGKGFAVVANEVKELAKQTAKATEEISQKIEAIQGDTKASVHAIGEIGGIINQINDISNSIASAVEEQTVTTNEINRSMAEASKGVADITKNITGVALAAKDTTQGANNSQKAAQELSRMAARLQAVVSRFTF
jgi:methyl-accepting chemotaxis protein